MVKLLDVMLFTEILLLIICLLMIANSSHEIISSQYTNTNETYILKGEIQFLSEDLYHDIKMGLSKI